MSVVESTASRRGDEGLQRGAGAARTLDARAVAGLAYNTGLRGEALVTAVAVAKGESGFRTAAKGVTVNIRGVGPTHAVGLWQILLLPGRPSESSLVDPAVNAAQMHAISGGGSNWHPWTIYTTGAYRAFLDEARAAAQAVEASGGAGGVPAGSAAAADPTSGAVTADVGVLELAARFAAIDDLPALELNVLEYDGVEPRVSAELRRRMTSMRFDLSSEAVTELTVTYDDPDLWASYVEAEATGVGRLATWHDLVFEVDERNEQGTGNGMTLELTLRSAHGLAMADLEAYPRENASPTTYVEDLVAGANGPTQAVGAAIVAAGPTARTLFVGQGTATRTSVGPTDDAAAAAVAAGTSGTESVDTTSTPTTPPSYLEVTETLAEQEGFLAFETAGVFFFGKPSWIVDKTPNVRVGWRGSFAGNPRLDSLEPPSIRYWRVAEKDAATNAYYGTEDPIGRNRATVTCKLPPERGRRVRPGFRLTYATPLRDVTFLVTEVSWDTGTDDGVSVTAELPADPKATGDPEAALTDATASSGPDGSGQATGTLQWPVNGTVTSGFGHRASPGGIGSTNHQGLDIAVPVDTTVYAADGGTVSRSEDNAGGYGVLVVIDHGGGRETRYGHLHTRLMGVGSKVSQGQAIAKSDTTGTATGPHVHFEVREGGVPKDPMLFLPGKPNAPTGEPQHAAPSRRDDENLQHGPSRRRAVTG